MVNINIEIPADLHKRIKIASTLKEQTLKKYIIEQLEKKITKEELPR